MLTLGGGVAWAQNEIRCTADTQPCMGTDEEDQISGGSQPDTIYGLRANDDIAGQFGNDTLYGDEGSDAIGGSFGDDAQFGGEGPDELRDFVGNDVDLLVGGPGNDGAVTKDGDGLDTIKCGKGKKDRAVVDRGDTVSKSCESISRRR